MSICCPKFVCIPIHEDGTSIGQPLANVQGTFDFRNGHQKEIRVWTTVRYFEHFYTNLLMIDLEKIFDLEIDTVTFTLNTSGEQELQKK